MSRTRIDIIWMLIGALILGILAFAAIYWIFHESYAESISLASTIAAASFVGELLRGVNFRKKDKST